MKYLKHLAISTLLALNAFGGWHDTAPFVAWPATNHLRWVDNVGVYTNASNPTNTGYGAWTNNLLLTNLWYGENYDLAFNLVTNITPLYYDSFFSFPPTLSSGFLNAKDTRLFDCTMGVLERHLVLSPGNTVSNFITDPVLADYGYAPSIEFYRGERDAIAFLKTWILNNCASFYYTTNGWQSSTNYSEISLCAQSGVVSNFLRYTPSRSADSSSTVYQRILTNTFVLCQGTNAAQMATNSLIDSAGVEFTAVGTNGTLITRIATNVDIQAGASLGDYGFDGLRRVITNLTATAKTPTWGIGGGTNWSASYSSNFPAGSIGTFNSGPLGSVVDLAQVEIDTLASFIQLQYPLDSWGWQFPDTLSSFVTVTKTNTAPYAHASASWSFVQNVRYLWGLNSTNGTSDDAVFFDGTDDLMNGTNFSYDAGNSWYGHSRGYGTTWDNYAAPLVYAGTDAAIDRTLIITAKTNGASFVVYSNSFAGGTSSLTTDVVRIAQPSLGNFGVQAVPYNNTFFASIYTSYSSFKYFNWFYACASYPSNTLTGADNWGWGGGTGAVKSESTNCPVPTVTADKAIEIWDFEYK